MKIAMLPIGAKLADKNRPNIILRVAGRDLPGYPGTIVVTDSIIKQGCFDAQEPTNPDDRRRRWGNNNYPHSNAHQWLNADGPDWFKPTHEHDAPPIADHTYDGDNPYMGEPGFLTAFSDAFKAALTEADIKTRVTDDDSIQTIKAKAWLMSATEVGFDKDGDEGAPFPLFEEFRMRIASPTAEAVETASYQPESFNPDEGWYYWLRSPYSGHSNNVRLVNTGGSEAYLSAYHGSVGLRPALLLKSDISVSDEPDERGVYIIG